MFVCAKLTIKQSIIHLDSLHTYLQQCVRAGKEDPNKRVFSYDYSYWSFGERPSGEFVDGDPPQHTQESVFEDLVRARRMCAGTRHDTVHGVAILYVECCELLMFLSVCLPVEPSQGRVILDNAFQGYNCSLMAYGQTGSGKSYSVENMRFPPCDTT